MHWLLLKGIKFDGRHWGDIPARLSSHDGIGSVHTLDAPGVGTEAHRPSPLSIEATARDMRRRWLALRERHPGPWNIFGISMGGMVAMSWAHQFPGDFDGVVIGNSSAAGLTRPWERLRPRNLPTLARAVRSPLPRDREAMLIDMLVNEASRERRAAVADRYARLATEIPPHRTTLPRQFLAGLRFQPPARLHARVLVVCGGGDRFVSPRCSARLARHLDAELRVHPRAGHNLGVDAPEWLMKQLRSWTTADGSTR